MDILNEEADIVNPLKHDEAQLRNLILYGERDQIDLEYSALLLLNSREERLNHNLKDFYGKIKINFYFKQPNSEIKNKQNFNSKKSLFLNFKGTVNYVLINGEPQNTKEIFEDRKIFLDLNKLIDSACNSISIIYSADYTQNGRGLHYFKDLSDQKEYLYSQFETFDCNRVFPCFDQPDIKGKMNLSVIAKEDWIVLSNEFEKEVLVKEENLLFNEIINGLNSNIDSKANEENEINEQFFAHLFKNDFYLKSNKAINLFTDKDFFVSIGYKIHCFGQTDSISSYLYAVCAGYYHEMKIEEKTNSEFSSKIKYKNNPPIRIFCRQSLKEYCYAEKMFKILQHGIVFYENYFGFKFPFNKYDQIFVPEFNFVACENVGLVTFDDEKFCFKTPPIKKEEVYFAIIILHELSHMWFGNLITMKWWDDLWLNESFATFISFLCLEKCAELAEEYKGYGWELFNLSKDLACKADDSITTHPIYCEAEDTFMAENNFDDITYEKGSSVLKQLYKFLGDELFSSKLKVYFQKYQWKNTTFKQFIEVISEAESFSQKSKFGNINFYETALNWLTKAGLCEINAEISVEKVDGEDLVKEFFVRQTPLKAPELFESSEFKISEIRNKKSYFYDLENYQTHLVDVLFIYDFGFKNIVFEEQEEYLEANLIFNNVLIKSQEITELRALANSKLPKIILLNFEDYGFFKWIIDENSLNFLRKITSNFDIELFKKQENSLNSDSFSTQDLIEKGLNEEIIKFYNFDDRLSKLNIFKALYDMVFENKLKIHEFMDITSKLILFEKNANIVNVVLKRLIKVASYSSYSENFNNTKNKFKWSNYAFKIILLMLKLNYQSDIRDKDLKSKFDKDDQVDDTNQNLIKIIYNRLLKVIKQENQYKILLDIFTQKSHINIKDEIFYPKLYSMTLSKIFESKVIYKDFKFFLLKKERESSQMKDLLEDLESECEMKLPEAEIKKKVYYDVILNNKENQSLQTIHNIINNFYCANQEDILYEFMNSCFFEDYESVINKNELFLTTYYMSKLTKFDYSDKLLITKLFKLAEKIKNHDVGFKMVIGRIDKVNKIQKIIFNN